MAEFEGFEEPTENWFRMPRAWPNITAGLTSLAELKVIEYVLCHTWGFGEYRIARKRITTDEFMHGRKKANGDRIDAGTGLSERGVQEGVRKAIADGYLVEEINDRDKARIKRYFTLHMKPNSEGQNLPPGAHGSRPRGARSKDRSEKETLESIPDNRKKKEPSIEDYKRGRFGHVVDM